MAHLEHVNLTVSDPKRTAAMLCDLFGWHIRWEGAAISGGYTLHVGTDEGYLAIYSMGGTARAQHSYSTVGSLNHVGIVVDDLDAVETRVRDMGYTPHNHADYEPGKRFYFDDADGIEFEVVTYA